MAIAVHEKPEQAHPANQPTPNEAGATASGPRGDNPATGGPGKHDVQSNTPENATGRINPSSPEDANVTPGSVEEK
jgi:hypothetical protein